MSKIYRIPVAVVEYDEIVVKAKSKKEAIKKALDKDIIRHPNSPFRIVKEDIKAMSQKEARRQGVLESDWMDE